MIQTPSPKDDKDQIIVTLALIQQALQGNIDRVNDHHKVLFGNGNPENSVVWAIRKLAESIESLKNVIEDNHDSEVAARSISLAAAQTAKTASDKVQSELDKLKDDDANLSWVQWFKRLTVRWFPMVLITIILIISFHDQLASFFSFIAKLI